METEIIEPNLENGITNVGHEGEKQTSETTDDTELTLLEDMVIDDSKQVMNDLAAAVDCEELHDVRFMTEIDGRFVTGNKVLIASSSKYWRQMFHTIRQDIHSVTVEEVRYEELLKCVKYMQTGKLDIETVDEALVYHILAEEYVLAELTKATLKYIAGHLNMENIWQVFKIKSRTKQLFNYCVYFMVKNCDHIFRDKRLVLLNKEELIHIFTRESFRLSPTTLLHALHEWLLVHKRVDPITVLQYVDFTYFTELDYTYVAEDICGLSTKQFIELIEKSHGEQKVSRKQIVNMACELLPRSVSVAELTLELKLNKRTNRFTMPSYITERNYNKVAITCELSKVEIVNFIRLKLTAGEFAYYIETSLDEQEWIRVVDRSSDCVQGEQFLYFPAINAKMVRVVGVEYINANITYFYSWLAYINDTFSSKSVEIGYVDESDTKFLHNELGRYEIPTFNAISEEESAVLFVGNRKVTNCNLLKHLDMQKKCEHSCKLVISEVAEDNFIDIALSQPFYLYEMTILLGKSGVYTFNVYTWSTHEEVFFDVTPATLRSRHPPKSSKWKLVAACEDVSGKQLIQFEQQLVSVISIECRNAPTIGDGKVFELIDICNS